MDSAAPRILSLCVGLVREHGVAGAADPLARPWVSGTYKAPVTGPVWLTRTGLRGDGQADLKVHGGPEKAVLAYAERHYAFWRELLAREDVGPGAFGENFVLSGGAEDSACIGDRVRVGTALLEVSQPRQPCWKQARRWNRKDLPLVMQQSGRTGWYFRVLEEGTVAAGDALELLERPFPAFTVAFANHAMHAQDREAAAALAECPRLTPGWRESLARRAAAAPRKDDRPRLVGPNDGD
ncbi:MOSC domain-containing protein [Corallococcus sp. H22C18031201]|uniref:MOSC domain-containing protein n=1 Tax=Citreicoccus inhibens TaxID=2849499 RepID=UPI000E736F87|nr:MOSC domain-containing protein [Citreicoccus inhibens]MBU8895792.1 MOSC domain-containing protein [Citreicoccus inhibens]RJS20206.1 MOSC domain-containing protein [Corallococcus sp. H22C18031201]